MQPSTTQNSFRADQSSITVNGLNTNAFHATHKNRHKLQNESRISARPEFARIRNFLEELASACPAEEITELTSRIQSGNDTHFKSATFELFLYTFLSRLGFQLVPHPQLPNGVTARPDFHVTTPSGMSFYLEATLASMGNDESPAVEAMIGTTLDALAQARHPNFMVGIEHTGAPSTQPSGKRLLNIALRWLDSLDVDSIRALVVKNGLESAPTLPWSHESWHVELRAIPLMPEMRGNATTLVGMLGGGAAFIETWSPITKAVKFKGSKYGALDKPLLVAVNVNAFHLDRIDEMQALYGQEQFVYDLNHPELEPRSQRAPNGAWRGKSGPQMTRVSGAWFFNDLSPYSAAARHHTVYFNPWAKHPLPDDLKALPHAIAEGNKMRWSSGIALREIFDLPPHWPDEQFTPAPKPATRTPGQSTS